MTQNEFCYLNQIKYLSWPWNVAIVMLLTNEVIFFSLHKLCYLYYEISPTECSVFYNCYNGNNYITILYLNFRFKLCLQQASLKQK